MKYSVILRQEASITGTDYKLIFIYVFIMLEVAILNVAVVNFNVATVFPMKRFLWDVRALVAPKKLSSLVGFWLYLSSNQL